VTFRSTAVFLTGFGAALAAGWLAFPRALYRTEAQPLQFNHQTHAGKKVGAACADCHALSADGRFAGVPSTAKCGECHPEAITDNADEKRLVADYVKPGREVAWRVYARQPDNASFPHAVHTNLAKLTCERCHGEHGKSSSLRLQSVNRISGYSRETWDMNRCMDCHAENHVATGCAGCHK
jgi:menaquinone reductase, multiheme cytochrome c subunit